MNKRNKRINQKEIMKDEIIKFKRIKAICICQIQMDFQLKFLSKFVGKKDQVQKGSIGKIARSIDLLGHPFFLSINSSKCLYIYK